MDAPALLSCDLPAPVPQRPTPVSGPPRHSARAPPYPPPLQRRSPRRSVIAPSSCHPLSQLDSSSPTQVPFSKAAPAPPVLPCHCPRSAARPPVDTRSLLALRATTHSQPWQGSEPSRPVIPSPASFIARPAHELLHPPLLRFAGSPHLNAAT
ncbi:hypothetical protein T484DRAFT_3263550 [Baffinella frigidus]|nr:hypothetical protein T484DRAFT_3263550 [Cryptophyta sp. CCMP2293]